MALFIEQVISRKLFRGRMDQEANAVGKCYSSNYFIIKLSDYFIAKQGFQNRKID